MKIDFLFDEGLTLFVFQRSFQFGEAQGQHHHDRNLRGEGLGGSHTDLRACMGVDTCIGDPRDGGADNVADAQDDGAFFLGQLDGGQGVGSLTRL